MTSSDVNSKQIDVQVYVTDTHSLIWYFNNSSSLGESARKAFEQVAAGEARLVVPAIVVAELIYVAQGVCVRIDLDQILTRLTNNVATEIMPLTFDMVLAMRGLSVGEMHDRLIVAQAKALGAKLITRDEEITSAHVVETIW